MQIELEVVGLTDQASVERAVLALRDNVGVKGARVYLDSARAFVDVEKGYTLEHLLESLESAGFMARPASAS